jgi:hypothetical protein
MFTNDYLFYISVLVIIALFIVSVLNLSDVINNSRLKPYSYIFIALIGAFVEYLLYEKYKNKNE